MKAWQIQRSVSRLPAVKGVKVLAGRMRSGCTHGKGHVGSREALVIITQTSETWRIHPCWVKA